MQWLLVNALFLWVQFSDIKGEEEKEEENRGDGEDAAINICNNERNWFRVNRLTVPMHLRLMVELTRLSVESLAKVGLVPRALQSNNHHCCYHKITTFINPINSTREF